MFSGSTVLPDSKEIKTGSSNQEVSLSAHKNIAMVLVSCCSWKCIPTSISGGVNRRVVSESHKNYFKDWCALNSQLTFLFLTHF